MHEVLELDGLSLKLSVARPLSRRAPLRVLYVLDPEPELFALTCAHIFVRAASVVGCPLDGGIDGKEIIGVNVKQSDRGGRNLLHESTESVPERRIYGLRNACIRKFGSAKKLPNVVHASHGPRERNECTQ
jgi:hypothetical protein